MTSQKEEINAKIAAISVSVASKTSVVKSNEEETERLLSENVAIETRNAEIDSDIVNICINWIRLWNYD